MKDICSINGTIVPVSQAKLDLSSIEAQYTFGVYETIKVRNSVSYFLPEHINRLFHSAEIIRLRHLFTEEFITGCISKFLAELQEPSCNLKVLLYGSAKPENATLYILASKPYYPDRKWYKNGVTLMSFQYERWMPSAKTLNMLPSYYYYARAKENGHYDALLLDHKNNILEGTRTNVYLLKGNKLFSSPKDKILEGVTMMSIEKIIQNSQFSVEYREVPVSEVSLFDGMIVTSTSSKILPVRQIDSFTFEKISAPILELEKLYESAVEKSGGDFKKL
jgi:branched-subunit amino acid aminotransferase/4-amino-4-deoxychorismate lyase